MAPNTPTIGAGPIKPESPLEELKQLIQDLQEVKDMIGPTCEAGHFKNDPVLKHFVEDCVKLGIYNITLQKRDGLSITVNLCHDCFKLCEAIHQALNGGV